MDISEIQRVYVRSVEDLYKGPMGNRFVWDQEPDEVCFNMNLATITGLDTLTGQAVTLEVMINTAKGKGMK